MNIKWLNFSCSTRHFLARRFLIPAGACLALSLMPGPTLYAQATYTTYPIGGIAGFETGLRQLASLPEDILVHSTIDWGDGTGSPCSGIKTVNTISDTCSLETFEGGHQFNVYGSHRYALPGTYTISITYLPPLSLQPQTVTTTATISPPGDFVILSIGDSVASGEGDPPVPASAGVRQPELWGYWDDPYSDYPVSPFPADEAAEWPNQSFPCHRSLLAGPAQAAQQIQATNPNVTFVHYACSGAKVNAADTAKNTVQDAAGQLIVARKRLPRIDVLIISAGANDFNDGSDCVHTNQFGCGFGALFKYCILHGCNDSNAGLNVDISNSLGALPSEYGNLAKEINCVQPPNDPQNPGCTDPQKQIPKLVLITEYMDPTHDQNGHYPGFGQCPSALLKVVTYDDWAYIHDRILAPLNSAVDHFPDDAHQAGLTVPTYAVEGIGGSEDPNDPDDFYAHGICAGGQRWVLTPEDSTAALGDGPHIEKDKTNFASGSGHPNLTGQADYFHRIYNAIVAYNPPVTTPSATADGAAYTFGTWTNHDVVVTLSAMNAIKESGVGSTFYAVDNANCSSGAAGDCFQYSAPFEVSRSGKHTVTFFSENAQGFPEAAQSAPVWIDKIPPHIQVSGELLRLNHEEEEQKLVRIEISGKITDSLSGVDASSATYMVENDDGVLQTGGPLTLAPDGTYSLVVSFKRTRHREDEDRDENERDRKKYKITVSAQDNAGNRGSASTFAVREKHRGDEDRE